MKCNVGGVDRSARIVIGVALVIVGLFVPMNPAWQTVLFILAAIALVTAIVGFCPANALIGVNTCKGRGGTSSPPP